MLKKYDLFISYSNNDQAWVEGYLLEALKGADVYYHTEAAFALGTVRVVEFERAIQQSKRTLLVLSPAYLTDGFNQFIDQLAQSYGLDTQTWPVIPLLLHPVELPPRLSILVKLNATNPEEQKEAIRRLCTDLKNSVPAPTVTPACPYPGMMPFSEEMSDRFFGRDEEVQEFLERLRLHHFIAVIGPSGSGKSSLVLAGLLPKLRHSSLFGAGEWLIQTMRPSETPLAVLKTVLGGELTNLETVVTEALRALPNTQRLLLVVDQFEEVFTLGGEEARSFGEALLRLLEVPNCYLILTVRADFYPELMGSPLWDKIKSRRLEVVPLDAAGLRKAIIKPAEDVGVFVESALVERIVLDAAGEPGVLPLIQETLLLLWQRLERRYLPLRAYEVLVLPRKAYGGLGSKKLTGLQVAISRRADAAIADWNTEQEKIARRIFLRLVQFGEGRADTRRQQLVNNLRADSDNPTLFDQTLQHLADCRLLTLSGEDRTGSTKADIAHEALISAWPALQEWLTERREAEQIRRRLVASAEEWERLGQGSGGLLDEVELAEAQRWLKSPDATELGVDQKLTALVAFSERSIQEAKKQEEELKQRELTLIKERLEQETKARKASQTRNIIAIVYTIILTGLTFFTVYQWRKADKAGIQAFTTSSKANFVANRHSFDALIAGLRAGKQLKQSFWYRNDQELRTQVMEALGSAVYGVRESNRLEGHEGFFMQAMFSPDGQTIATASYDHKVKLWNSDGKEILTLKYPGTVTDVSFSPKGQKIATASVDGIVRLWDLQGTLIKQIQDQKDTVWSVTFSPDSQTIAGLSYLVC